MTKRALRTATIAALALVATSAIALADGNRRLPQRGEVVEDSGASVKLTVLKRGSTLVGVRNVHIRDLTADCESGTQPIDLDLYGTAPATGATHEFTKIYSDEGVGEVVLEGKIKRDGDKVVAELRGSSVEVLGIGTCKVPTSSLKTKR